MTLEKDVTKFRGANKLTESFFHARAASITNESGKLLASWRGPPELLIFLNKAKFSKEPNKGCITRQFGVQNLLYIANAKNKPR